MENPISYAKHHKYIMGFLVIAVILTTAVGARLINKKPVSSEPTSDTRVHLVAVADFLKDKTEVSANGTVESLEQADIRSQASGPVAKVNVQIGQKVRVGDVLISLQNEDIAAQVAQAEAVLRSQEARLDEMKKGARNEQIEVVESALKAAEQGLKDTKATQDAVVNNAYSALLNTGLSIIPSIDNTSKARITLGGSYTLGKEGVYKVVLTTGGDKIPFSYAGLETGTEWIDRGNASPLGKGGLFVTLSTDGEVTPGDFWTVTIPNPQSPGYAAAKNGYETALKARDAAINGATSALNAAQKQYDLVLAGASSEQIAAQSAAVDQARASVRAATAQLNKTIIRSPINGEVASVPVKYGELVSPGTLVASVVSKGGLQVKAYVSDYDLPLIEEGGEVLINDRVKGQISRISPSIDPTTKNIEITVAINDAQSGLVIGQNASLKISARQDKQQVYLLPIQAVKISNAGASVFKVKEDSTLEEVSVELGSVSGENVEVIKGLEKDLKIVGTVYELKAGQKVVTE